MKVINVAIAVISSVLFVTRGQLDDKDGIYNFSMPDYEPLPETNVFLIDDVEVDLTRNGVSQSWQLWPDGVIPYVIDAKYPKVVSQQILAAMREIEQDVNSPGQMACIQFTPRYDEKDYIHVLPRGSRCSSAVGRTNYGRQEVSIGRGCEERAVIMHELTHAIGFHHEQNRPDRDFYINIDTDNILLDQQFNFEKASYDTTLRTQYDFSSIMHYGVYDFAVDETKPVLTPKRKLPKEMPVGQRLQLSINDVRKIQRLYKCKEDTSHVARRVTSSGQHCDFGYDFCGFTQDTRDDFNWYRQSGASTSGPKAGISTGLDSYAIAIASSHRREYARLVSKWFTAKKLCVDFWFYFSGRYGGDLQVIVRPKYGWDMSDGSYIAQSKSKWFHIIKTVVFTKNVPYQIVFQAYTQYVDIALDDVNIYEGGCV